MAKPILLDGGMGTMLQSMGLQTGHCPEALNLTRPEAIIAVQRQYVAAGSNIIYANTFGANRLKAAGSCYTVPQLVEAGIRCAKAAAGGKARVALDIGPIGRMMEPYGTLTFDEAYDIFAEMIKSGVAAGADLIVIETMTDLYEARAAVLAAKEQSTLPVFVTMTFEKNGRTFAGTSLESFAAVMNALQVDAFGINCSLGPAELLPLAERLSKLTNCPLIIKPNAGLPDPKDGSYHVSAQDFAALMPAFVSLGAQYLGGCCGTTPDFIRALSAAVQDMEVPARHAVLPTVFASPTRAVTADHVLLIGERLNPTGKKRLRQSLLDHDLDYIARQAVEQADAGADLLDVNCGVPGADEAALLPEVVRAVQSAVELPLQLDSADPAALEAALRIVNGKPIINSVNGEESKLAAVLPLARRYGAAILGLTMDENGIPKTAEGRFRIAERILSRALALGIPKEDVLIDCLTLTVSAEPQQAAETLAAVRRVHNELGLKTVLGVSNISFGLPQREKVTASFLTLALSAGLDLPILNPLSAPVMDAVRAFRVISGEDASAAAYIAANANAAPAAAPTKTDAVPSLESAILRGLSGESKAAATALLASGLSLTDIVSAHMIPALNEAGARYEKGTFYLPQLMNAASAASAAFEVMRSQLPESADKKDRGVIIIATVKGDIHDIGKNIVATVLQSYGFRVVDLGRDVSPEAVLAAAEKENAPLIGLSALMTTTLPAMEATVRLIKSASPARAVMVGGAVVTAEWAAAIGADFYAPDAKAAADIAQRFFGTIEQ